MEKAVEIKTEKVIGKPLITGESEPPAENKEFVFSLPLLDLSFNEPEASIGQVTFKKFNSYKYMLISGLRVADPGTAFVKQFSANNELEYVYAGGGLQISKRFIFKDLYNNDVEIKIRNTAAYPISISIPISLGTLDFEMKSRSMLQQQSPIQDIAVSAQGKITYPNPKKSQLFENIGFIGIRERYFCTIIQPDEKGYSGFVRPAGKNAFDVGVESPELKLAPGEERVHKFKLYIGPQDATLLASRNPEWKALIYFGKFDFIAQIMLGTLSFTHKVVKNWGLAIIILSLLIYLVLYPLTIKQMRSMKEMQVLQPKVEQLKVLYKDNSQRMNKELMELYKEHKVNPLGGCLPLLLQMPVFFTLYQVLNRSIALKGAEFLWIKDLSEPDKLAMLPVNLPVVGDQFNILPIIIAIIMFVQQKFSTAAATGEAAQQQKIMMIVFPFVFGLVFYHMPSGLVLYWLVNSLLMMLYQIKISKIS